MNNAYYYEMRIRQYCVTDYSYTDLVYESEMYEIKFHYLPDRRESFVASSHQILQNFEINPVFPNWCSVERKDSARNLGKNNY